MPKKTPEEVVAGFNVLRTEQRQIANKIMELENDLAEHKIVIEALRGTDQDRKCYRMIGGVLVERTVKEVLPDLNVNADQMKSIVSSLNGKLMEKGKEINAFKDKHPGSFVVGGGERGGGGGGHPEKIVEEDEDAENKPEGAAPEGSSGSGDKKATGILS